MTNPCKQCLVTSACMVSCKEYTDYIIDAFKSFGYEHSNFENVAKYIRFEVVDYICSGMEARVKGLNDAKHYPSFATVIVSFDRQGSITNIAKTS